MAKHKYIESPEKLEEHFRNYCAWVELNPIKVQDFVGKDGDEVMRKKDRPLTLDGFEVWCYNNGIINDLGDYFSNKDDKYSDFSTICSHIKKAIRSNQIDGGMAGIFNPSITQRLNGLTEKTDNVNNNTNRNITIEVVKSEAPLSSSEKDIKMD